jgi:hypothetical protein
MSDLIERLRNIDKPLVGGGGGSGNARRAIALEAANEIEGLRRALDAADALIETFGAFGRDAVGISEVSRALTAYRAAMGKGENNE